MKKNSTNKTIWFNKIKLLENFHKKSPATAPKTWCVKILLVEGKCTLHNSNNGLEVQLSNPRDHLYSQIVINNWNNENKI